MSEDRIDEFAGDASEQSESCSCSPGDDSCDGTNKKSNGFKFILSALVILLAGFVAANTLMKSPGTEGGCGSSGNCGVGGKQVTGCPSESASKATGCPSESASKTAGCPSQAGSKTSGCSSESASKTVGCSSQAASKATGCPSEGGKTGTDKEAKQCCPKTEAK